MVIPRVISLSNISGRITILKSNATAISSDTLFIIPKIIAISPNYGTAGDTILLKGNSFSGALSVKMNSVNVNSFIVVSDDSLKLII